MVFASRQSLSCTMNDTQLQSFQSFLEEFCSSHHGEVTEDGPLPIRFLTSTVTVKEVEAEVIDWVHQYLTSKCPRLLATHIARTVADYIAALDFIPFVESNEEDDSPDGDIQPDSPVNNKGNKAEENPPLKNDTVLLISALAPVVFTKVHTVCDEWNQQLPTDRFSDTSSSLVHHVSVHAIKNTRRKMEDKHVVHIHLQELYNLPKPSPSKSGLAYIGVFDGHGGVHGSNYAACHFHDNLVKSSAFISDIPAALKDAFLQTDKDFCAKAERERLGSGSTAVCAVVTDNLLHIGWLGDSEGLLVRDGRPVKLVTPHKPERQDEQDRIAALGGFVESSSHVHRVNGLISVARAIGDRNLKPFLCADADVVSVELDGSEDYVVLACDGLWDVVSHSEIVEHVYKHVEEADGDKSGIAQMLVRLAKEQGSEDNITVVVVFLREKTSPPSAGADPEVTVTVHKNQTENEKNDGGTEKERKNQTQEPISDTSVQQGPIVSDNSKTSSSSDSKISFEAGKKQAGSGTLHSMEILEVEMSPASTKSGNTVQATSALPEHVVSSLMQITSHISPELAAKPHKELEHQEKSSTPSVKSGSRIRSKHSDTYSGGSGDLVLLAAAAKCVSSRRGRRGRNGRRRNNHRDTRRASKDSTGVAHRTTSTTSRLRSSSESKVSAELKPSHDIPSSRSGGENVFRVLMGCNPSVICRSKSQSRWTVAVEMELEAASAMFEDVCPERDVPRTRRVSKK